MRMPVDKHKPIQTGPLGGSDFGCFYLILDLKFSIKYETTFYNFLFKQRSRDKISFDWSNLIYTFFLTKIVPDKKQKSVLALSTANPSIHWGVVVDVCVGCVTWIWFWFWWFWLTGKTLAFGIPAVMHVLKKRKSKASKGRNPLCLVLSPTRELAQQVCYCLCTVVVALNLNLNLSFW